LINNTCFPATSNLEIYFYMVEKFKFSRTSLTTKSHIFPNEVIAERRVLILYSYHIAVFNWLLIRAI